MKAAAQVDALARAFFARFFESEITAGTDDLKQSFFWLLAALAMPGIFIPTLMSFEWGLVGQFRGYEILQTQSMGEKAFYLGFTMVASGALTAIAWTSLIPDKRDTLILGTLPIRPAVVVVGKLAALAAYIALIAAGMHLAGTLIWASLLGNYAPFAFMLRSFGAHFVACASLSATTALAVAAAQGLTLSLLGPHWFRRASTILQVLVVSALALFFALLPVLNGSAVEAVTGGPHEQRWILALPPMWFLGLYEWMLGSPHARASELAGRAVIALVVPLLLVVVTYPLAYRRLMVATVEAGRHERGRLARVTQRLLVRVSGRAPAVQAAAEFFTATIGRVERHRFVLAITIGVALAWSLPGLRALEPSAGLAPSILSLPIATMMFLLAGLRVASVLPGDPRASWLFEVHDVSRAEARQAVERMMLALGVLPPILLSVPLYWQLWGVAPALIHAVVMAALGVATTELLIWHCSGMPCGSQWTPARMGFGRRWPLHFGFFLLLVGLVPHLEVMMMRSPMGAAIFVAFLVMLAVGARIASARHEIVPVYEEVDPVAGVLRIN